MKYFYFLKLSLLLLVLGLFNSNCEIIAQIPKQITFQGILSDSLGVPYPNGTYKLQFAMFTDSLTGDSVWGETHTVETSGGLFDIILGTANPISVQFNKQLWVAIKYGDGNYFSPRLPITGVPYSLFSDTANFAKEVSPDAKGLVLSLNGIAGSVEINGGNIIETQNNGNKITLNLAQNGAAIGQVLKWNGKEWAPSADSDNGIKSVAISSRLSGNGTSSSPIDLAQNGATTGQILKWNGAAWIPQDESGKGTTYSAGSGIKIDNGVISNSGDIDASDDITKNTPAGGDLTGIYPNPTIAPKGASVGQVLKWNGMAWIPQNESGATYIAGNGISINGNTITNTGDLDASNDITTSTYAGGDLTGNFSNLKIASKGATVGQVLKWTGTAWVPQDETGSGTGGTYNAGPGISISGGIISNTGDRDSTNDITNTTSAGGDLLGTYPNPTLSSKGASAGQVLKWNGTAWTPQNDDIGSGTGTTYTAGKGISISGSLITNIGDTNALDDITNTTTAGGDLTGIYPNPKIASKGATDGQVLKWNGTTNSWEPAADNNSGVTSLSVNLPLSGTGTSVSPLKIVNGATDGQVLKWNGVTNVWEAGTASAGLSSVSVNAPLSGTGTTASPLDIAQNGALNGQVLKWNGSAWTPQNDDNSGIGSISTNIRLSGNGTTANPLDIAQNGATNGQVLKWNSTSNSWVPSADNNSGLSTVTTNVRLTGAGTSASPLDIAQNGATNGQVLKWNSTSNTWVPSADNNSGLNTVSTNVSLTGSGTTASPLDIAQNGALNGQVLKWNGSAWTPQNDDNSGIGSISTNIRLSGNGTTANPLDIAQNGATNGQVLKWNSTSNSWVPSADNNSGLSTVTTNVSLTGSGTTASPLDIAQNGALNGQVLKWNGSAWTPQNDDNSGIGSISTNIRLSGNGTTANPLDIAQNGATNGQVLKWNSTSNSWVPSADNNSGLSTVTTNVRLTGAGTSASPLDIAQNGATNGQVLKWNSTSNTWVPSADNNSGLNTVSTNVSLTGSGTTASPLDIAQNGALNGQVLKWNGSAWTPQNDDNSGIGSISTNIRLSGNGTTANPLDIAQNGATNGQVLKWNSISNSWVPSVDNNSGLSTVVTNARLTGLGTSANPLDIAQNGALNGQVLKWNSISNSWVPSADNNSGLSTVTTNVRLTGAGTSASPLDIAQNGATNGQVLKWNSTSNTWVPSADNNSGLSTVTTNVRLTGAGTSASPLDIAQNGALNGQVLKWNGSAWTPQNDDNSGIGSISTNIRLSGNGTTANPLDIAQNGATNGQVLKWNSTSNSWVPSADNNSGLSTVTTNVRLTGAGTSASPLDIAQNGATNGQVLKWNSTSNTWIPSADNNSGLSTVTTNVRLTGAGTSASPLDIAQNGATNGQVLKWNSTSNSWVPSADVGTAYTAGPGITIDASNKISSSTALHYSIDSLADAISDGSNLFMGMSSGTSNSTGTLNTAVGAGAMMANTSGQQNTAIGYHALKDNTNGQYNVGIGFNALTTNTTGFRNTAIGTDALMYCNASSYNTAIGAYSLINSTTGTSNTSIGDQAMKSNNTGSDNTALGKDALFNNATGSFNVALGEQALNNSTGNSNIAIGYKAGDNITTGASNIIIGYNIDAPSAAGSNQLNIGGAILGDLSTNSVSISGPFTTKGKVVCNYFASTTNANVAIAEGVTAVKITGWTASHSITGPANAVAGQILYIYNGTSSVSTGLAINPNTGATFIYDGANWLNVSGL